MKSYFRLCLSLTQIFLILFVTLSCDSPSGNRLERERLFTLSYGRFEDEIDLFRLESGSTGPDTQLFMRDGMFYLSNSGSKKILQLTSFGDLLSVYYNPEVNPVPSFAHPQDQEEDSDSITATRKAVSYPFNHPVFLTVDNTKRLSVADRIPFERQEFDSEEQVVLRDIVLRFAADGRFSDYLGQEGPGGTPFPPIVGLYSNATDETIVVSMTQSGLRIFWFDADGNLLYRIPISFRNLPSPFESGTTVFSSVEKVLPDYGARRLYLKIDYYTGMVDESTGSNAGIAYAKSALYPFDIASESYLDRIDISSFEGSESDTKGSLTYKKPYELLGITTSGWIVLASPVPEGYAIELMDSKSRRIQNRVLSVQSDELAYNALHVSPDGILSALLATPYTASVVWWRTDALIGEIRR
ncbi:MAG: hypothetical protein JW875_08575 [Spirochaetales bacterium]|nr:hypothetical protein [Spirochaetales bacterium]